MTHAFPQNCQHIRPISAFHLVYLSHLFQLFPLVYLAHLSRLIPLAYLPICPDDFYGASVSDYLRVIFELNPFQGCLSLRLRLNLKSGFSFKARNKECAK